MVGGSITSAVTSALGGVAVTNGGLLTVSSPQAGNITMSTANRTLWGRDEGTNKSMNINDWSQVELQNFVKWFIEVNYPDAVKEYQAVRDIERQAQEAERLEQEMAYAKQMEQYYRTQLNQAQNAYQYPTYTTSATQQTPPKKSFWERCKELAKSSKSHGDYY